MIHQEVALKPLPGDICLWSFDLQEVGGELPCTSARSFLYYLASEQTQAVWVGDYHQPNRTALLRVYGPICDEQGPLFIEMRLTGTSLGMAADNNIRRLSPEEIEMLRAKLIEHVKRDHPEFPRKGKCDAKVLLAVLGLPRVR